MAEASEKEVHGSAINDVQVEVNDPHGDGVHRSESFQGHGFGDVMGFTPSQLGHALKDAVTDKVRPRRLSKLEVEMQTWSPLRLQVNDIISTELFDLVMGAVIIFNVGIMLAEADARAKRYPLEYENNTIAVLNTFLLGIYFLEACSRAFVDRQKYFRSGWNCLDFLIVFFGIVDLTLGPALSDVEALDILPLIRVLRVARLLRAVRLLRFFPELYIMVRGFIGAMKAMFWGLLLIIVLLGIWALVCTEVVQPTNYKMLERMRAEDPDLVDPICETAFNSIFNAALFHFQTLVAGDSWGGCIVPLVKEEWSFFIIFALALVSVSLGFMNLVLAVIVDNATAAREGDREEMMKAKKKEEEEALKKWKDVIKSIDADGSGTISHDELIEGYEVPEVRDILEVMGIGLDDLEAMFNLMDEDGSGDLNYDEFIDTFLKAQGQDLRIYLMMTKLQLDSVAKTAKRMNEDLMITMQEAKAVHESMGLVTAGATTLVESTTPLGKAQSRSPGAKKTNPKIPQLPESVTSASFEADLQKLNLQIQEQFKALAASIEMNTTTVKQHTAAMQAAPMQPGDRSGAKAQLAKGTPAQPRGEGEMRMVEPGSADPGSATSASELLGVQDGVQLQNYSQCAVAV